MKWRILLAAFLVSSCALGARQDANNDGSNTVKVGGASYSVTKSVVWGYDGTYFDIDVMQDGITVGVDGLPDPKNSHGFWAEFEFDPANPASTPTNGTFTAANGELSWLWVSTYNGSTENDLFDDEPDDDAGSITVAVNGGQVSIHGFLHFTDTSQKTVRVDYDGPYNDSTYYTGNIVSKSLLPNVRHPQRLR